MIKNLFDLEKNEKRENKGIYNAKKENKDSKKNLSKSKERLLQYPQVVNNYDVNVKVNVKKLNDNKINIENMNIGELISRKIESNNKKNKYKNNLLEKNEKKEFFNKTDNNINFLNFLNYSKDSKSSYIINNIDNNLSNINKNRNDIQNGEHYNNIISNLKNEFKLITKGNEINNENIYSKEKKSEKLKNYLFDINNNKNKKESNNNVINNILNNNKENKNKKFTWNLKSMNNNIKKDNKNKDNNYINSFKDKGVTNENKMKTQNNFYKIPKKYIKINNDISNLRLTEKNEEHLKLKSDKINKSLNKNIILINNKRKDNNLNLTDCNLKLNSINDINDNNNMINIKKNNYNYNYLNLTYNSNNNNNINKDNSLINLIKDNNIIEEYNSTNNHNKKDINKYNNFINKNSSINKTQSFIKQGRDKEKNNLVILRNNQSSNKFQNHSLNNQQPKLLYLDKRINKIKRKLINEIKKEENNSNCNGNELYNMKIENNISFSYIKKINKNKNDNFICSKGLNLINKILNIQSNIIFELKQKLFIIKNVIIKKNKEISNLKNICMKLMWLIKSDNINKENNKRKIQIQNQIIKENMLLRKLYVNNTKNNNIINKKDINIINNNIKQINDINEEGIFNNVMKSLKEKKNNNFGHKENNERLITFENNERFSLKEKDYYNDKKRNKSYERRNEKNRKEIINNKNKNNETDIIKNNTNSFYYNNYIIKLNKYNEDNNDNNNIKIGKKIKYITK